MQHFKLVAFRVIDEKRKESEPPLSEATVMIEGPDGSAQHTVARGNGPLNALDLALRKALLPYYPQLKSSSCTTTKSACSAAARAPTRRCAC